MKYFKQILLLWLLSPLALWAQNPAQINANIHGKIIDKSTQEPITGASVTIKGTTNGGISDVNGDFSLNTGQKLPFTVIVKFIGYHTLEKTIDSNAPILELVSTETSLQEVVVTSRRRTEKLQEVPIPVAILKGNTLEDAGAFNVNRMKELIPTVQLYASNPRNTTLNIRGLGSTFGLTNDGIDPGVGFYIDGVYLARPAATALDFVDIEQVEVLRGPQGTLFGKNTTSGAFNITTRLPEFKSGATFEASYGNYGYIQAKTSLTGPLSKTLAARVSFSGTQRDGTLFNVHTNRNINDINNIGLKGQLLWTPSDDIKIVLSGDATQQRPDGIGWGIAGVVKTQRADYRQFDAIIKDLNYTVPYKSAFERKVDLDTQSKADNDLGGVSLNADFKIGNGTLTSTSAYRYWDWVPLNDRDYTGLPVFTISAGTSKHKQWSQEFRYSGKINDKLSGVVGLFGLWQDLNTAPVHIEEAGAAQWRFAKSSNSPLWETPGLFDNFGIKTNYSIKSASLAIYTQLDWEITPKLHLLPGLRYNFDKKDVNYDRQRYGGLETTDPALLALKNGVYSNQSFTTNAKDDNFSGQISAQYKHNSKINAYATYSISYKPVGVNVGGLPTANGQVLIDLDQVKPEAVQHKEIGIKTSPGKRSILNVTFFQTDIKYYQTQVQTPEPGVNRGYLANAEKVRVKGFELEGNTRVTNQLKLNASFAYTDGKYIRFTNAPVPLEEVGGAQAFKDISGGRLPGISKYAGNFGAEYTKKGNLLDLLGNFFVGADVFARSEFSSNASPSKYLNIDGYTLLNGRVGFRASNGITAIIWGRNIANKNYYEQLLAAPGSYGQYAGIIGDPRTYGFTLRYTY